MNLIISFFSKLISKVYIPYKREISIEEVEFINGEDLATCLIIAKKPWQLSNLFIKGYFKHSMVFATGFWIMDSTVKEGTKKTNFRYMASYSEYKIYKPKFDVDSEKFKEICFDIAEKDIPYDHYHRMNNDLNDCAETSRQSYLMTERDLTFPYEFPFFPEDLIEYGMFQEIYHYKAKK